MVEAARAQNLTSGIVTYSGLSRPLVSGLLHWWGWWLDRPEGRISDLLWTQNPPLWFINQNVKKSSP